jgi:hypothetical protein
MGSSFLTAVAQLNAIERLVCLVLLVVIFVMLKITAILLKSKHDRAFALVSILCAVWSLGVIYSLMTNII